MGTMLLKTKLRRPTVQPGLIYRSRLLKILDEGLGRNVPLLSADGASLSRVDFGAGGNLFVYQKSLWE